MSLDEFFRNLDREMMRPTAWRPPVDEEAKREEEANEKRSADYRRRQQAAMAEAIATAKPCSTSYTPPTAGHLGLDLVQKPEQIEMLRLLFDEEIRRTPPTEYANQVLRAVRAIELRTCRTPEEKRKAVTDALDKLYIARNRLTDFMRINLHVEDRRDYNKYIAPALERIGEKLKTKQANYDALR